LNKPPADEASDYTGYYPANENTENPAAVEQTILEQVRKLSDAGVGATSIIPLSPVNSSTR
jgi:hypothetical protein